MLFIQNVFLYFENIFWEAFPLNLEPKIEIKVGP